MALSNYERMIALVESSFDTKNDPNQLDVNEEVINRLFQIHPSALIEKDDGQGPYIWIVLIPTTNELMQLFLENEITEAELFEKTPIGAQYETIYLCSAMTLQEYRNKGITKQLCLEAIENMRQNNPISSLFVWSFSKEGESLAEKIAIKTGLKLFKK
jgi:predicted kinase